MVCIRLFLWSYNVIWIIDVCSKKVCKLYTLNDSYRCLWILFLSMGWNNGNMDV